MNCKIQKSKLNGRITCPSNKSYTHRAIFLAALSDGKSIVKKILRSNDTISTINACRGFGVEVEEVEDKVTINNTIDSTVENSMIDMVIGLVQPIVSFCLLSSYFVCLCVKTQT